MILYVLVCLISGKGLPPSAAPLTKGDDSSSSSSSSSSLPIMMPAAEEPNAGQLVDRLWGASAGGAIGWSATDVAAACAEDVVWEDLVGLVMTRRGRDTISISDTS